MSNTSRQARRELVAELQKKAPEVVPDKKTAQELQQEIQGPDSQVSPENARALAAQGAAVVCCDVTDAEPVAVQIRAAGGEAIALHTDVTSRRKNKKRTRAGTRGLRPRSRLA